MKQTHLIKLISFILIIYNLLVFNQFAHTKVLGQSFEDSAAGFAISIPSGWVMEPRSITPGPLRAKLRFEAPVDQFIPNVSVRVSLLAESQNLKNFIQNERSTLPKKLKLLEEKPIPKDPGYWPEGYQWKLLDPKLGVIFLQRFFVLGDKSYVITAAAKESTWKRFGKDIQAIFYSFQLKDPRGGSKQEVPKLGVSP